MKFPNHESQLRKTYRYFVEISFLIHAWSLESERLWLEMIDTLIISFPTLIGLSELSRKVLTLLERQSALQ